MVIAQAEAGVVVTSHEIGGVCYCDFRVSLKERFAIMRDKIILGELFVKPRCPQDDSDSGQLTLWENFFGQ